MAQEIEIIVRSYAPGVMRPKVVQIDGTTFFGVITGDKMANEIGRFAAFVPVDADVATLLAAVDAVFVAGGQALR